jgi:hypothetical protein
MKYDQLKLLALLVGLVLFVNYRNYLMPDRERLGREIALLQAKIEREKKLNASRIPPERLRLPWMERFYDGKRLNYSQAMGDLQKAVQSAAGTCKVVRLTWAQVPAKAERYDRLRMNFALRCPPGEIFAFADRLRARGKLVRLEDLRVVPTRKRHALQIQGQIIAYRIHDVR